MKRMASLHYRMYVRIISARRMYSSYHFAPAGKPKSSVDIIQHCFWIQHIILASRKEIAIEKCSYIQFL